MLITRLVCIQWKSWRFLSPVSTVSARNAWEYDLPFGEDTKRNKETPAFLESRSATASWLNTLRNSWWRCAAQFSESWAWPKCYFQQRNKKYTFSNKRNLWLNKNIRLADLARASKFMIGPFRSFITMASFKVTISTKLHLVVDFCVFTSQVM